MKIDVSKMILSDYLEHEFECSCGRIHSTKLKAVEIGENVLISLPEFLNKYNFRNPYIVCDEITYDIAGKKILGILDNNQFATNEHVFKGKTFIPDEEAEGELLVDMDNNCDVVIAVGTGSINDLVRFFSFKIGRPFITIATAAPMDGFASSVAALIIHDFKTTFETQVPTLIIGDTKILKNAPASMITAGLGDILGKFTCLCDWELSQLINNEYYCPIISDMVNQSIKEVHKHAYRVRQRNSEAVGKIMEALVLTGVAMSFVGNSRPAAGSEHHLSHFWEMLHMQRGISPVLHGSQVGIGTIIILKIAELLVQYPVDFKKARKKAKEYDYKKWVYNIKKTYGLAADGIVMLEKEAQKNDTSETLKRLDSIEAHWTEICEMLKNRLPSVTEIKDLLKSLGAPYLPIQIGIDDQMLYEAIIYAKETRARYTILQLVWDLGLSEHMAGKLVEYVNSQKQDEEDISKLKLHEVR